MTVWNDMTVLAITIPKRDWTIFTFSVLSNICYLVQCLILFSLVKMNAAAEEKEKYYILHWHSTSWKLMIYDSKIVNCYLTRSIWSALALELRCASSTHRLTLMSINKWQKRNTNSTFIFPIRRLTSWKMRHLPTMGSNRSAQWSLESAVSMYRYGCYEIPY